MAGQNYVRSAYYIDGPPVQRRSLYSPHPPPTAINYVNTPVAQPPYQPLTPQSTPQQPIYAVETQEDPRIRYARERARAEADQRYRAEQYAEYQRQLANQQAFNNRQFQQQNPAPGPSPQEQEWARRLEESRVTSHQFALQAANQETAEKQQQYYAEFREMDQLPDYRESNYVSAPYGTSFARPLPLRSRSPSPFRRQSQSRSTSESRRNRSQSNVNNWVPGELPIFSGAPIQLATPTENRGFTRTASQSPSRQLVQKESSYAMPNYYGTSYATRSPARDIPIERSGQAFERSPSPYKSRRQSRTPTREIPIERVSRTPQRSSSNYGNHRAVTPTREIPIERSGRQASPYRDSSHRQAQYRTPVKNAPQAEFKTSEYALPSVAYGSTGYEALYRNQTVPRSPLRTARALTPGRKLPNPADSIRSARSLSRSRNPSNTRQSPYKSQGYGSQLGSGPTEARTPTKECANLGTARSPGRRLQFSNTANQSVRTAREVQSPRASKDSEYAAGSLRENGARRSPSNVWLGASLANNELKRLDINGNPLGASPQPAGASQSRRGFPQGAQPVQAPSEQQYYRGMPIDGHAFKLPSQLPRMEYSGQETNGKQYKV